MSRDVTKMSCAGLTLGKIIFGYTPRVVLPPQQPVSNATMEQVQRWGEDVSNDGLDAIYDGIAVYPNFSSHSLSYPPTST